MKANKNSVNRELGLQLDLMSAIDVTPLRPGIIRVDSPEYKEAIKRWSKSPYFVIDIETTDSTETGRYGNGLDPYAGRIRLIQICLPDDTILVYDCFKDNCTVFMRVLEQTLVNPDIAVVGQNIYFDLMWLKVKYGFIAQKVRDTRVMSINLWAGIKYYRHSLAEIYKRLFGEELSKEQQMSDWGQPELSNSQINYAAEDPYATKRIYIELARRIETFSAMPDINGCECQYTLREICIIECECIPAFVDLTVNGMPIDINKAIEMELYYLQVIDELYKPIQNKIHLPFSANPEKLALAIWRQYNVWLLEDVEDKKASDNEDEDNEDADAKINLKQLKLFADEPLPEIPDGKKLSTSSSNLFSYYEQTKEEDLLIISLVRSLKKCYDAIKSLQESAQQHGGYARSRYTALGNTGSGRSTSGGDKKGTAKLLNLQNLPNPVKHDILKKYKLPKTRDCIIAKNTKKLSIIDLSSSHARYMALLTDCPVLLSTFDMKDPHLLLTSKVFELQGRPDMTLEKLIELGGKDNEQIAEVRSLAKTAFYLSFNVGGVHRLQAVLAKAFTVVDEKTCKQFISGFKETYESVAGWQRNLTKIASKNTIEVKVQLKNGGRFTQRYSQFRTPDGRLFHAASYPAEKTNKQSGATFTVYEAKVSDLTSVHLMSPEAINMKKAMKQIFELKHFTPHGQSFNLLNMVHDEIVCEADDNDDGRNAIHEVYKIISGTFSESLLHIPSGMDGSRKKAMKTLADCYSEK